MPFGAAVAVLDGAAGIDQFTEENIPLVAGPQLMRKVVMAKDPASKRLSREEWPARVAIELSDGLRYEKFVRHPKGDPDNPLSWARNDRQVPEALAGTTSEQFVARVRSGDWGLRSGASGLPTRVNRARLQGSATNRPELAQGGKVRFRRSW